MTVRTGRKLGEQIRRDRNASRRIVLFDENSTSDDSYPFEVFETPLVLQLYGATGSQTVEIWTLYKNEVEAQFLLNGIPIYLNQSNNVVLLSTSGRYRAKVTMGGRAGLTCTAHKQTADDDPDEIPQPSGVQANRPNLFLRETGLVPDTNTLEIIDKPWLFTAYGLQPGEYIEVLVIYGHEATYREEPFLFNGAAQVLLPTNSSIVLDKAGRYRFKLTGSLIDKILVGNPTGVSSAANTGGGVSAVLGGTGVDVNSINPFTPIVSLDAATLAALAEAASALQAGDNISLLNNDAGYLVPGSNISLLNNNSQYLAPGSNISLLNNDAGYTAIPNTDALAEGLVNKYFTDARARAAVLASSIVNGDTTHAPTGEAVYEALLVSDASIALKADKSLVLTAGAGLTGGGDLSTDRSFAIADTGVTAGPYGSSTHVGAFLVNSRGQIELAQEFLIQPNFADVAGKPTTLAGYGITDGALDTAVVHIAGTETVTGAKTFSALTRIGGGVGASQSTNFHTAIIGDRVQADGRASLLFNPTTNTAVGTEAGVALFYNSTNALFSINDFGTTSAPIRFSLTRDGTTFALPFATLATIGVQSGGGVGTLRVEATGGARVGFTNTGSRRYTIGNNGSSFTIRDESAAADRMLIESAGKLTYAGSARVTDNFELGSTSSSPVGFYNTLPITGATLAYSQLITATAQSDVTNTATGIRTTLSTQAAAYALASLVHFRAEQGTIGAGSSVTAQYGFFIGASLIGATNNYGLYSAIPSGTGRWNVYATGTASNYFAGKLGIGTVSTVYTGIHNNLDITGSTSSYGYFTQAEVQSDSNVLGAGFRTAIGTQATAFTLDTMAHYMAGQGTIGAGSSVTAQAGFLVTSTLTGATNNYGFRSQIAAATGRWNVYMDGTANNHLAGNLLIGSTTDSGEQLQVTGDIVVKTGRLYGTALHNNATALTGTTNQYVGSGTYTPTATNVANVSATTVAASQWIRVGNVVTVSGRIAVTTTAAAATLTQFRITLPIASALAATNQLGGAGNKLVTGGNNPVIVSADITNDQALLTYYATTTASAELWYNFTYVVV